MEKKRKNNSANKQKGLSKIKELMKYVEFFYLYAVLSINIILKVS